MGSVTGTYEMVEHFRNFVDRPCTTSDYTSEKKYLFSSQRSSHKT